jgi:deoxycytidylate deaminase
MSPRRFTQLVKEYLPQGNLLLGIANEDYVLGLEDQPQFKTLRLETVQTIIDKVNTSPHKHKIYTLRYSQRDAVFIYDKLDFAKVLLVNGSWYHAFHLRPEYYALAKRRTPFHMVTPFANEQEARDFANAVHLPSLPTRGTFSEDEMLDIVAQAAKHSYDYGGLQAAVALGRKKGSSYELLATTHNKVVPYETYAMHFGASREKNLSPMQDLNHYDTVHAEMLMLVKAQREHIDLAGVTLFINLLPCPHCSRTLSQTDLAEVVYTQDHSAGYAVKLLEKSGKKVRRLITAEKP